MDQGLEAGDRVGRGGGVGHAVAVVEAGHVASGIPARLGNPAGTITAGTGLSMRLPVKIPSSNPASGRASTASFAPLGPCADAPGPTGSAAARHHPRRHPAWRFAQAARPEELVVPVGRYFAHVISSIAEMSELLA